LELSSLEIDAILLSIKVSIWSFVFSLLPAVYIAYVLSRKKFWGLQALNAMDLKLGQICFAFLKTVSVATSDIIL